MKTTEEMNEIFCDSDVHPDMASLNDSLITMESVEEPSDFIAELDAAIASAESLLKNLRALKVEVS